MILLLIRHANTDATGKSLSGRASGVKLNREGLGQAEQLAAGLERQGIQVICCSPLERACQTADSLARKTGLTVHVVPALTDIDFGDWTGAELSKLASSEKWRQWNQFRSCLRIPNGETMLEVQLRMLSEVETLRRAFPDHRVAIVSHADPIRTVLAHFLGVPLDLLHRMEIAPASVSRVDIHDWGAQVQYINAGFSSRGLVAS